MPSDTTKMGTAIMKTGMAKAKVAVLLSRPMMDQEAKDIVREVRERTRRLIEEHKEGFMQLGALLLEKEVIFADDIERILGPKAQPAGDDRFETPAEHE